MIHDIDILLSLVDSPVKTIRATGLSILTDSVDIAHARIRFVNGTVASIMSSRVAKDKVRKIKLFQQCVESQTVKLNRLYKNLNLDYELFNFTNNISEYFSKAELVITRSGSSVTAELINCNIPFISIPYPYAADSHQYKNATYFEKKGYSFLVKEAEVNERLFPLIKAFYKDKKLLDLIIEKQKKHSDKEVFLKINKVIKNLKNE
jgi:UDP-N-acetylglucosamine:LPS N-acetylglucosamine transferase